MPEKPNLKTISIPFYKYLFIACNLLVFFSVKICFSQDYSREFGKITNHEIHLKSYPGDEIAEAAILYDKGKSYFQINNKGNIDVIFECHTKIKLFTKAALSWAEIEIPFYIKNNNREKVFDLEAYTYNYENNKLIETKLDATHNSFTEKVSEFWHIKKFAMPNAKEGSIIEYKYKISSPYHFNLRDWEFQNRIPTLYSEYEVKMIPFYEYTYILQGTSKFDFQDSYIDEGLSRRFGLTSFQDMVHIYAMNDVPAFRDEAFIASINNHIIKLDFQLKKIIQPNGNIIEVMKTWPKLCNNLLQNSSFGRYIKSGNNFARKIMDQIALTKLSEVNKIKKITNYVKSNFNWNGEYRKYVSKNIKEFLNEKTGNSSEINLFLTSLLQQAGIEAHPVLISTRDHGRIASNYPFLHFFNYVIAVANVGNKKILIDATESFLPYNKIPIRCFNGKGLIVKKNSEEWVTLSYSPPSTIETNFIINYNAGIDSINAILNIHATEYDALKYRKIYLDNDQNIQNHINKQGYKALDSIKIENYREIDQPFRIVYHTIFALEKTEDKILISPFLNEPVSENFLKQKTRTYPVDMVYKKERIYNTTLKIPEGYQIMKLPKDLNLKSELVSISYQTEVLENNSINIEGRYAFKQEIIEAEDYPRIKYYFNEIIDKFNEQIVFVKTEL